MRSNKMTTILTNGTIYTMDPRRPRASTVVIRDGKVLTATDGDVNRSAASDRTIDLEGRCVLPGLTDSHIHLSWYAVGLQHVDLAGARSLEEIVERVADRAAATPAAEWIQGRGWNQEEWSDRRFPTAADLDPVTLHHPVALTAKSGHALVCNSIALQRAGVTSDTPDPEGGQFARGPDGRPTGLALEKAMDVIRAVIPQPDAEEIAAVLPAAFRRAWQVGLTATHDMASPSWNETPILEAYQRLHARGELGLRIVRYLPDSALNHALAIGLRAGWGDDWLRIGGIKIFGDGALGPHTAAMLEPYAGEPDNLGIMTITQEQLTDLARQATEGGFPLAIHALGDRAIRMMLDALEAIGGGGTSLRHRIEHVQVLHPDDVGRLAALGVIASMQPIHAPQDASMADRCWEERTATAYAWRSLLDAGTVLAFGSDCPVEDMNPFLGIHAAVTRVCADGYGGPSGWHPEQRITVEEAVRAYTLGAAYAAGLEDRLGSLSPGKWADLVVLDRDIFTCDPADIVETQVEGTMIAGEWMVGNWA
jgi:predicted amidohydrolase YtcJ